MLAKAAQARWVVPVPLQLGFVIAKNVIRSILIKIQLRHIYAEFVNSSNMRTHVTLHMMHMICSDMCLETNLGLSMSLIDAGLHTP